MARQTPLSRFCLGAESPTEATNPVTHPNPQRTQTRIRRSACSDLQNTAIPEERVYHGNRRRASLFAGRPASQPTIDLSKISSDKPESSEGDYIKLCRQRCRSLYKSLANKTSNRTSSEISPKATDQNHDDDEEEIHFQPPSRTIHRYSLPDASPAALALRNILKRNKTTKYNRHVRIGLPSHSSHSLSASITSTNSSSSSSASPISTFRNILSLVKLPSTKSSTNSPTSPHSSLTMLSNATGGSSTTLDQTISSISPAMQWHFDEEKSQWCSSDGISKITLGSIELHNLTYVEHKQLKRIALQRLQSSQYDLGMSIHLPKEEPVRKRKHYFMFRSKSSDKSKEAKDAKSNGNVFGVALSQCVNDDDGRFQDDNAAASGTNRKDSNDTIGMEKRTSPSGSISSTNDSGCSISPASPSSLYVFDADYEGTKFRSVSLEALGSNEATGGINRIKTLRCYPAKVPDLVKNCCDYLEKHGLQTVGLFRVGVSKKRLRELKEQVNSTRHLTFDSSTNVHDVAGLIKEFLRELPEPLLTRDLCGLFLTLRTKLNPKDQSDALSYLISLLPSSHRDTLYTLLKFLNRVSQNSQDRFSTDGKLLIAGNKMDAANLAIVFAPTILMDGKAPIISSKDTSVAMTADQLEQGKSVLKMMIEQYKELFMVSRDLHNKICLGLYESESLQLMRALAFKVQKGCGISSMQLDETNEQFLMSVDVTAMLCEIPNTTNSIFSAIVPRINSHQIAGYTPRRYNLRRNSDFPCSSTHPSRSSEFLQVPMSLSQQRLHQQTLAKLSRARDIREARMDQIVFRVIDPVLTPIEPIINVSAFEDILASSVTRPNSLNIKEPTKSDVPFLREIKAYTRSKTAPLSSPSGAQQYLSPKLREARDLCGSSSNDDLPTTSNRS